MTANAQEASASENEVMIQLLGVNKWYDKFHVLKDINLEVSKGERIVVCGPSGSGKSTMIRCINRLEEHQKGQIIVDGIELTNDLRNIETRITSYNVCYTKLLRNALAASMRSAL